MPLDVVCPQCGEIYFETNDKKGFNPHVTGGASQFVEEYDPDRCVSAAMIRLKDKFVGVFDDICHDKDLFGQAIGPCPNCGSPLSNDSFTIKTKEQETDPCACEICGEKFPSERAKKIHKTMAHSDWKRWEKDEK